MSASEEHETGLHRLAELASEFATEQLALTTRLVADRVSEGRFYVACAGQFKRGKSTLLNALVGRTVLPSGIVPVTSVPTILRYGVLPDVRLRLPGSDWKNISTHEIEDYASEKKNPENVRGVAALEIFIPCRLLETGMCLVDTPGLGSVFQGNTKATKDFVPQIDAALFVFGVDPPISGDELDLVEKIAGDVPEVLFILNKADRASEADCATAINFTRQVLETRLGRAIPEIFEVSALDRLENRGPERDWPKLVQALERLMQQSRRVDLVRAATERAARRAGAHLLLAIEEDRRALKHPLEESEFRINQLRVTIEKTGETTQDLGALLSAEQQRFSQALADRRRSFLHQVRDVARAELQGRFSSIPSLHNGPAYRREVMHLAQEIAREKLLPWLEEEERYAGEELHRTMQRFVELGHDFLRHMNEMGLPLAIDFQPEIDSESNLQSKSRFQFHLIERIAAPASPLTLLSDLTRGVLGLRSSFQRQATEFLDQLLEVNTARVQSDVDERVREGRLGLEKEIKSVLRQVLDMTEHALARARAAHASGTATVRSSLARLDDTEREINSIVESFKGDGTHVRDLSGDESNARAGIQSKE